MRRVGLWYVVLRKRDGSFFWAYPHRLSTRDDAVKLRDELKAAPHRLDARIRFWTSVPVSKGSGEPFKVIID